jgi:hypothetical protein
MYHEKLGVFLAANGSYVAFAGSANETRRALEENFECIDVFAAWKEPERAGKKKAHFEELWENRRDGLLVVSFPEAAKCRLLKILAWQAMNSNEGTGYPTREEHEAGSSCGVGEADLAPC